MSLINGRYQSMNNRLKRAYSKVPLFYKVYAVTSGITYCYFPETLNTIALNTGVILVSNLVQCIEDYVKHFYPDKLVLCDVAYITGLISKLGALGFVSNQLTTLKTLHSTHVGSSIVEFGYYVNSRLLNATINSAYFSFVFGTVSSFSVWCGFRTFKHIVEPVVRQLLVQTELHCRNLINTINTSPELRTMIETTNNIFLGLEPSQPSKKVFTETELNKIAPVRCLGFGNCLPLKVDICPVCTDNYNEKQMHRTLPCAHTFHVHCIDNWLLEKTTVCPICRQDAHNTTVVN